MNKLNSLPFPISLNTMAHQIAQEFYQHQSNAQKAKQVYLNTLAVYAVNHYLNCLNIQTDLENSNSWNTVMQTLSNVADLTVKNHGKVECRPVLPNSDFCHIPAEVWLDRIAYIAVQLNPELTEAKLLGVMPQVTDEKLPLNQLQPLEDLIILLGKSMEQPFINLSHWLQNIFEEGWVALNTILDFQNLQPAFRSHSTVIQTTINSDWIEQAKPIYLDNLDKDVALNIALKPTDNAELDIWVDLYPMNNDIFLPISLELAILDEDREAVMQAKTQEDNQRLQFHFLGHFGDRFSIRIRLGEFSFTQPVVI